MSTELLRTLLTSEVSLYCYLCPAHVLCEQDEASELMREGAGGNASPEAALEYLSHHCQVAVVTLGDKGCMVKERGGEEVVREPACPGVKVWRLCMLNAILCWVMRAAPYPCRGMRYL